MHPGGPLARMTEEEPPPSRARALLALVLLLALVAGGWVLARHLAQVARTEDCLMAGRRNCAPIQPP
jgi:hypothetical protein